MTKADDRLRAAFALNDPPPRDAGFSAAVMERVMRRRFLEDLAWQGVLAVAGAGLLGLLWRPLQTMLVSLSQSLAPAFAVLAVLVCGWVILNGRGDSDAILQT